MLRRLLLIALLLATPALAQEPAPAAAQPSNALAVIVESLKRANNDLDVRKNYTYQEREVEKELDGNGNVKKTEIRTYDVVMVAGRHHSKLIAKNDQPLTEKEAASEEERIRKREAKEARHSDASSEKHAKDKEKEEERDRKFIQVMSEVYDFSFAGEDVVDGEPAWIIRGVPRASYQPHSMEARLLKCMQGQVWITKRDYRWAKADAEMISDFKVGLFLLNLHKGMHIELQQTRINDEVWLPKLIKGNANARMAWHSERVEFETTYSNYRKFKADAKVTGVVAEPQ
jgi:hypothetical protein